MNKISGLLFILLAMLCTAYANAQHSQIANNFNTNNSSIASNIVYNIVCDKYGYLWLATDKGIVKYDGSNFINFNTQNGLPDNEIINLFYQPQENSLWALGYNSKLFKINTINHEIKNVAFKNRPNSYFLYGYKQANVLKFLTRTDEYEISNDLNPKVLSVNKFIKKTVKEYLLTNVSKVPNNKTTLHESIDIDSIINKYFANSLETITNTSRIGKYATLIIKTNIYVQNKKQFYCVFNLKNFIDITDEAISDIEIINNDLYLAVYGNKGGLYCVKNYFINPKKAKLIRLTEAINCNSVCKDGLGNIWFSLNGKGLSYISALPKGITMVSLLATKYDLNKSKVNMLNDSLIVVNKNPNETFLKIQQSDDFFNIIESKKTKNFFINGNIILNFKNLKNNKINNTFHHENFFLNERTIYTYKQGRKSITFDIQENSSFFNTEEFLRKGDIYQNTILIYTNYTNFYTYNTLTKKITSKLSSDKIGIVKDIFFVNNDYILLCTDNGLYSTNINFTKIKVLSHKNFKKVIIADGKTYLIDDYAVYIYHNNQKFIQVFNTKLCSQSLNLLDFDVSKKYLHLLTNENYIQLDKFRLLNLVTAPNFDLAKINLGHRTIYNIKSKQILNNLQSKDLKFTTHFFNPENNYYQKNYSFTKDGEKENWIPFTGNSFLQTNITDGNYTLKIKAKLVEAGLEKIMLYHIIIEPYFWQTNWFLTCCVLLAIGLVSFITYFIINKQQKKKLLQLEFEKKVSDIENKAFLNQLNPHFLYNALNTLQDYIIQKDTHNGIIYLQRIAAIHRNILQFNQKGEITVLEEKTFLDKYLFVQQKRYSDKFSFEISYDEEIGQSKLPPMLLQPLVENAIEHGFANRDKGNHLIIIFKKDKFLKITITDNGNGDLANLKRLKDGHALQMIKERLDFINQKKQTTNNTINFKNNTPKGIIINITIDL